MDLSGCGSFIYILRYYINASVYFFFLKMGFYWTFPRDCTVGTSLGGTIQGILGGFPGRVLSAFGVVLWVILWAYYMSHLALRIKGVIS